MQIYELCYLILPSVAEDAILGTVEKIKSLITNELGGEIPFKHPLAYSISKTVGSKKYIVDEAYIGWIKFESEPAKIGEFEAGLKKISEILRFLVVKAPRKTEFTFALAKAAIAAKIAAEKEKESASAISSGETMEEIVVVE